VSSDTVDIDELFEPGAEDDLEAYVALLHPADIAELLDFVEEENWTRVTSLLSADVLGDVLANLDESHREQVGAMLQTERLIEVVDELETDDAADVLQDLPEEKSAAVLHELEDKEEIKELLKYPEDSAGGIMQTELCSVEQGKSVGAAIEAVRQAREDLEDIYDVYVVDKDDKLKGTVDLEDLVLSKENTPLSAIVQPIEQTVTAVVDQEEVAGLFKKYDLAALPVVDDEGVLLGRITFDDVHDVIEEEATEDVMAMAGAGDEDLVYSGPPVKVAFLRLPWLLSSLLGSLVITWLVPMFANVPGDTLVLAAFVPVVMAMSGNVGSQSAMIITRGFAIGRVDLSSIWNTFFRETGVGLIMGLAAGTVVGIYGQMTQGDPVLGIALGASMVCSMTAATLVGVGAPVVFKRMGIDPAIAAGPLVTTSCDVLGVSVFLVICLLVLV